jgi:hypothetical protein
MATIERPRLLMSPAAARELAAALRAGEEDGWTYTVKDDPTGQGYSFIEIHDDDGQFVGHWTA